MGQNHLARLDAPKSWVLSRKENRWTARPLPGPHGLSQCITLNLIMRNILGVARTAKEINMILYNGKVSIDGRIRKTYKFPAGLMDVVTVDEDNYRALLDRKGRFYLLPINKNEASQKLLKIKNKCMINHGRLQLTFHDGKTMIAEKGFNGDVGDSILFDVEKKAVAEIFKLQKGALIYLSAGKHVGQIRTVKDIIKGQDLEKAKVVFEEHGKDVITLMDYAFVIGVDKPAITMPEKEDKSEDEGESDNEAEDESKHEESEGEKKDKREKVAKKEKEKRAKTKENSENNENAKHFQIATKGVDFQGSGKAQTNEEESGK